MLSWVVFRATDSAGGRVQNCTVWVPRLRAGKQEAPCSLQLLSPTHILPCSPAFVPCLFCFLFGGHTQ